MLLLWLALGVDQLVNELTVSTTCAPAIAGRTATTQISSATIFGYRMVFPPTLKFELYHSCVGANPLFLRRCTSYRPACQCSIPSRTVGFHPGLLRELLLSGIGLFLASAEAQCPETIPKSYTRPMPMAAIEPMSAAAPGKKQYSPGVSGVSRVTL